MSSDGEMPLVRVGKNIDGRVIVIQIAILSKVALMWR